MPSSGSESGKVSTTRGRKSTRAAEAERSVQPNGAAGAVGQLIDLDFVRGLIAAVDESGIDSLEINRGGTRIRIAKTPAGSAVAVGAAVPAHEARPPAAAPPAAATAAAPEASAPAPAAAPNDRYTDVSSPMVGTFYRAPAPEAPPYVEVGSHVTKGQTLCILEAMKLMNELESELDGVVREILVSNADPVEFGQVLFRIEPSGSSA
jgi:acetyl-CoA carboxylase biotin carboxyl carrier protein